MTAVTRWWWVRHAPVTEYDGRVYGQTDVAANVADRDGFAALARALPRNAVWVTSHLKRTHQTAAAIVEAGLAAPEPLVEPDLAEQHFGDWQGADRAAVFAEHAEWHGLWLAPVDRAPPNGESFVQLAARARSAIERLTAAHRGRDIVAVAHGGTIKAAIGLALGLEPAAAIAFLVDNLSLTRLEHLHAAEGSDAWRVCAINHPP